MKKALALAVVFCMSINSFAAIVADNDGSAFITKAEFDSLKNSFQSQIDTYNSSIDSKIDGAIAAYLAGISTGKKTSIDLIGSDKNCVTFVNYRLRNKINYPVFNCLIDACYFSGKAADSSDKKKTSDAVNFKLAYGEFDYEYKTENKQTKSVVIPFTGTEAARGKMAWGGVCDTWVESWAMAFSFTRFCNDLNGYDVPERNNGFKVSGPLEITKSGYFSDLTSGYFTMNIAYTASTGTTADKNDKKFIKTQIKTGNWKQTDNNYSTLITYRKTDQIEPSVSNYLNTFKVSLDQTLNSTNLQSACTEGKYGTGNFANFAKYNATYYTQNAANAQAPTSMTVTAKTDKFVSIGMLPSDYNGGNIYLTDKTEDWKIKVNDKDYTRTNTVLSDGFPAFAGDQDDVIEWEPKFTVYTVSEDGKTKTESSSEVDVYVSYDKFTDEVNSTELVEFTQNGTKNTYYTTTNKKGKLKWTQKKKSIMFIKVVPHTTSVRNGNWEIQCSLKDTAGRYYLVTEK